MKEESQIQKFYKGANVFVTGGTGFMGKVLIEKLLRDTDVETIYVLVRDKKDKTAHMRIDSLFDDVVSSTCSMLNIFPCLIRKHLRQWT